MKKTIRLSNLLNEEIIIEDSEYFNDSVFTSVYQNAKHLIHEIVKYNEKNLIKYANIHGPINNIISFEGRRGTGKTSSMMSVRNALQNIRKNNFFGSYENLGDITFIVIDYINASLMEKGEDILELVLANMFAKVLETEEDEGYRERNVFERKELYRAFDEVYGILMSFKGKRYNRGEISPLRALTQLSSSQVLGEKIKNLIYRYLQYLSRDHINEKKRFLVIAIDDVDISIGSGEDSAYEILENIHRYLMIPGVIILMTYHYPSLYRGCEKHFVELYSKEKLKYEKGHDFVDFVEAMTSEYLDKIIPGFFRVHMQSLKKRDYAEVFSAEETCSDKYSFLVKIEKEDLQKNDAIKERTLGTKGNLEIFRKLIDEKNEDHILVSVKKFVLLLYADIAELYYDALGDEKHLLEPDNLRSLTQTYSYYKHLRRLSQEYGEDLSKALGIVYKVLLDDLYFRIAFEKLDGREREQFNRYLDVDIGKRSKDIVATITSMAISEGKKITKIVYYGEEIASYSYGELTYALYNAESFGLFSKELVECILDSYTIMMTQIYRNLITGSEADRVMLKKRLNKIIGISIASSWSNEYLPKLLLVNNKEEDVNRTRYLELGELSMVKRVGAMKFVDRSITWVFDMSMIIGISAIEDLKVKIQTFEILNMFFVSNYNEIEKLNLEITYHGSDSDYASYVRGETNLWSIEVKCDNVCFNIFNFVNNMFNGKEYLKKLHLQMVKAFGSYADDRNIETEPHTFEQIFEGMSLKKQFIEWDKKTGGFALPVYSLDMMYNIFKRQYVDNKKDYRLVPVNQLFKEITEIYDDIGGLLKAEDLFYFSGSEGGSGNDLGKADQGSYRFYDNYSSCPFISFFNGLKDEKTEIVEFVSDRMNDMISMVCQSYSPKQIED